MLIRKFITVGLIGGLSSGPAMAAKINISKLRCNKENNICRMDLQSNHPGLDLLKSRKATLEVYALKKKAFTISQYQIVKQKSSKNQSTALLLFVPTWNFEASSVLAIAKKNKTLRGNIKAAEEELKLVPLQGVTQQTEPSDIFSQTEATRPIYQRAIYAPVPNMTYIRDDASYNRQAVVTKKQLKSNLVSDKSWAANQPAEGSPNSASLLQPTKNSSDAIALESKPIMTIGTRFGTPSSPSGLMGLNLDYHITEKTSVSAIGGQYSSSQFYGTKAGSVLFSNSALKISHDIGESMLKLRFGLGIQTIRARYSAGTSVQASENPELFFIDKKRKKTFTGLTGSMGLVFTGPKYETILEMGQFGTADSSYTNNKNAAPFMTSGKPSRSESNKKSYVTLGFGLHIN